MHPFVYGILGGLLIGLSAAILLLFAGEMLGACGIVSSLCLSPIESIQRPDRHWKLTLLASFCLTSNLFFASNYQDKDDALAKLSPWAFLLGGLLVGFGTKLGNGCTSGHGICGLARFSTRSLASVCTFMCIGIVTAYLTQEETTPFSKDVFAFLRNSGETIELKQWPMASAAVIMIIALAAYMAPSFHDNYHHLAITNDCSICGEPTTTTPTTNQPTANEVSVFLSNCRKRLAPGAVTGGLFAAGLYLSQMVYPKYVFGFLNLGLLARGGENWDPTLMFVMGGGVTVSVISYQLIEGYSWIRSSKTLSKPILLAEGSKFNIPTNHTIDKELILGAMCFGLGWGITGLCPGPAIFLASIGVAWVLVCYWPAFLVGSFIAAFLQQRLGLSTRGGCDGGCDSSSYFFQGRRLQCSKRTCTDRDCTEKSSAPVDNTTNKDDQEAKQEEDTPTPILQVPLSSSPSAPMMSDPSVEDMAV